MGSSKYDDDEESKLLRSIPPVYTERRYSINGMLVSRNEKPEIYKSRWRSIRVMYLTMFLSSVSFSICMSSLYPYLKVLDSTATTDFLGWVVAIYSVGQLLASPIFGAWSNYRSRTREPIVVSLIINILANVLYVYLESIPTNNKIYLLVARAFIGFGAGNVAVVRSYVAGATTLQERTPAMANMSAFQAIGFIIGPLIQTAMVPLGFPGLIQSKYLHFDMYTATGIFSAVVGIINVLLLLFVFKEYTIETEIEISTQQNPDADSDFAEKTADYYAVIPTIMIFFSVLFVFAVFETIATPLAMHMFAWTKAKATLYVGIILGGAGVESILVFAVIKQVSKRFNERYLLLGGFVVCLVGFFIYLPWGTHYPDIQFVESGAANKKGWPINRNATDGVNERLAQVKTLSHKFVPVIYSSIQAKSPGDTKTTIANLLHVPMEHTLVRNERTFKWVSNTSNNSYGQSMYLRAFDPVTMSTVNNTNTTKEAVGCPYLYEWCYTTPAVQLWQFLLGTFFVAIGYPTCNVMSYALYSKILGPKPQGTWMGWLTAAGSLARTLGPVFVSQVYDAVGPRITFIVILVIIVTTIIGVIAVFKKLVPFSIQGQFTVN